jgi:23S rRNA G2069 N7-methylase RlmK/C1962 C5-methylase RlmI
VLKERLDVSLVTHRVTRALTLRQRLFPNPLVTNGYRLLNGEGDGLPGTRHNCHCFPIMPFAHTCMG